MLQALIESLQKLKSDAKKKEKKNEAKFNFSART
jgi:hypothetical protein